MLGAATGAAAMAAVVTGPLAPAPETPIPLEIVDGSERVAMLSAKTLTQGRYLRIDHFGLHATAGRAFELWLIRDGTGRPKSLGLLAPKDGVTVLSLPERIEIGDVLAISEEPSGGARGPMPTGPVIVAARVAGDT